MSDPADIPEPDQAWENRLPVRARGLLVQLRQIAHEWKACAEAARLATNPHATDTVLDASSVVPIGLPRGCDITFKLGLLVDRDRSRDEWIQVRARTRGPGRSHIEIMGPMGNPLHVLPYSTNVIHVLPGPR